MGGPELHRGRGRFHGALPRPHRVQGQPGPRLGGSRLSFVGSGARLVLASGSPRRADLLRAAGMEFEVDPPRDAEPRYAGGSLDDHVRGLALLKAREVAARTAGPAVVAGADTLVTIDGEVLGKPADADDARRMLRRLSGRTHAVVTGVAVVAVPGGAAASEVARTELTLRELGDAEIDDYLATGEPMDKAGAYAVQGRAGEFVVRMAGARDTVVGLPVALLRELVGRLPA